MRATALIAVAVLGIGRIASAGQGAPAHDVTQTHSAAAVTPHAYGFAVGDVLPFLGKRQLNARLAGIRRTGVGWVRLDLSWADVQPGSAKVHHWKRFDRVVSAAHAHHLDLLPTLAYTPAWARPRGCHTDKCAPASDAAFARFAKSAVTRYRARGVHTWEIWNEENTAGFWAPKPDAAAYSSLLLKTTAAIRVADRHAVVISGGLTATLNRPGAMDTRTFLRRMCQHGVNRVVDGIGYHPYTFPFLASQHTTEGTAWDKIGRTSVSFESILRSFRTPNLPIWITEYGAPTGGPGAVSDGTPRSITSDTDHVTQKRQAQIAVDAVTTTSRSRHIAALMWYADRDLATRGQRGGDANSNEGYFGLLTARGKKKPGYDSFREALSAVPSAK